MATSVDKSSQRGRNKRRAEERINNLLDQPTRIRGLLLYQPKKIRESIEGRFEIDEVIRIERRNDAHTISDKISDFSRGMIKSLFEDGYLDAKIELENRFRAELEKIRKDVYRDIGQNGLY